MGTPVKNILITLLINTSSNLKEKVMTKKIKVVCTTKHRISYDDKPTTYPTPQYTVFTQRLVSGHVYEVDMAIASRPLLLSIQKSKYQRDITSKMKQLCYLIRSSHSSRSLGGTGYFLRWNRRGEFEH